MPHLSGRIHSLNQPAQCVVILQSKITMICIIGSAVWTCMMVLANGPIILFVPWALRKCEALYEA